MAPKSMRNWREIPKFPKHIEQRGPKQSMRDLQDKPSYPKYIDVILGCVVVVLVDVVVVVVVGVVVVVRMGGCKWKARREDER